MCFVYRVKRKSETKKCTKKREKEKENEYTKKERKRKVRACAIAKFEAVSIHYIAALVELSNLVPVFIELC